MERTSRAAVVPVEMGWSDIGSWESLWDTGGQDETGNVIKGDVLHHGTRNSYLRSEGPMVAAVGLEDVVVVAMQDAVLVSHKNASQDVKRIHVVAKGACDMTHDVHYVRILLDHHKVVDFNGPVIRHAADIVARQVNKHQVLSALFFIG